MKEIPLTQGLRALVDDADYEALARFTWSFVHTHRSSNPQCGYAYRYYRKEGKTKGVSMHRQIMSPPALMTVDHINGNGLDNRKANLRICSVTENVRNSAPYSSRKLSPYKGVYPYKARETTFYRAAITPNRGRVRLSGFATEKEAALAYDVLALLHFKDFAGLNFPELSRSSPHVIRVVDKLQTGRGKPSTVRVCVPIRKS